MPKQTPKTSKKPMPKKSPLAPKSFPKMPAIDGLWLGAGESGTKYKDRPDVMLVAVEKKSVIAGALTKSSMPSAAVEWCRTLLPKGAVRGLVVNAGNANAFTGKTGDKANYQLAAGAAKALNVLPEEVFVASTGVIGEDLKTPALLKTIANLADGGLSPTAWQNCARAIMTTDTFPKGVTRTAKIGSVEVNLNGIAKGSGMIAPDMATMLAFFFTDADLPPSVLRQLVNDNLPSSFNAITVDSDTSTSDTVLLIATGARKLSGKPIRSIKDPRLKGFNQSLKEA
ncbi:MAG: bifunctional ornithine acetyltransferase/N-acetylglutamate synthase, partial [Candidatus Micropelagos thuwalensis]